MLGGGGWGGGVRAGTIEGPRKTKARNGTVPIKYSLLYNEQ